MAHKTIITCDKCGEELPTWKGITLTIAFPVFNVPVVRTLDLCRGCTQAVQDFITKGEG